MLHQCHTFLLEYPGRGSHLFWNATECGSHGADLCRSRVRGRSGLSNEFRKVLNTDLAGPARVRRVVPEWDARNSKSGRVYETQELAQVSSIGLSKLFTCSLGFELYFPILGSIPWILLIPAEFSTIRDFRFFHQKTLF